MKTLYSLTFNFKDAAGSEFWNHWFSNQDFDGELRKRIRSLNPTASNNSRLLVANVDLTLVDGSAYRKVSIDKFASAADATTFYARIMDKNNDWETQYGQDLKNGNPGIAAKYKYDKPIDPKVIVGPQPTSFFDIHWLFNIIFDWAQRNNVEMFVAVEPVEYDGIDPDTGLDIKLATDMGRTVLTGTDFVEAQALVNFE